jgi:multiple sugar transport system substrate-binding protein
MLTARFSIGRGRGMRRLTRRFSRGLGAVAVVVITLTGCQGTSEKPKNEPPSFTGTTLKLVAIDDAAILDGIKLLHGEWEALRGAHVTFEHKPAPIDALTDADIVVFPAQRMGDLVDAGVLATIPNDAVIPPRPVEPDVGEAGRRGAQVEAETTDDAFRYNDIAAGIRELVCRNGPDRVALPCGGSALVLVYREDAFQSEPNRAAAKAAGLSLEKPPATWRELDALARFFSGRDWNGDKANDYGIVLAMGTDAEGVADAAFLARAAGLGQHRDQYSFLFDSSDTLTPRIEAPPFVEALSGLVALKALGPPGMEKFDAAAARESFRSGKVAMLIDRAERAGTWSHGKRLGVAPLPESDRVYEPTRKEWQEASPPNAARYLPAGGGWVIGIASRLTGTQREAALDFIKYLTGPECIERLRAERSNPMLPVRISQMNVGLSDPASAPDVDSRLWADAVRRTLLADRVVPGLRIPDAAGYLNDLAKGRVAAISGMAVDKALATVAQAWAARTKTLGPERQLWHYRRSLNKLATLPEPPPRGQ